MIHNEEVIGTIAFMNYGNGNAILKKFFVKEEWRRKKVVLELYKKLIEYLKNNRYNQVLLDTTSITKDSHRFYEKAGFNKINKKELPFEYEYPDRNSYLYLLKI